jgi:hypothetical protein
MSRGLVATHRTCLKYSFAGIFRPPYSCPQDVLPPRWPSGLRSPTVLQQPSLSRTFASSLRSCQTHASERFAQQDASEREPTPEESAAAADLDPYEEVDSEKVDEYYKALVAESRNALNDDMFARGRTFRDFENSIDEGIIAVVDNFESAMSFESDEDEAAPSLRAYWNAMSLMLGFAYRTGNFRAQHALDTYRYRAREFVNALSETTPDPTDASVILSTLIGCLGNSPLDTLRVLSSHLEVPFYARADCLFHLRHIPARWTETLNDPELHRMYNSTLNMLRDYKRWKELQTLSPKHMALMLENLSPKDAGHLLRHWEETFPRMLDHEAVWLALTYTRLGHHGDAVRALGKVSSDLLQSPNESLMKAYISLLKTDSIEKQSTKRSFRILPSLLELGLPPLDIVQNMVVQNTAKSGLTSQAFDLFGSLEAQNVPISGQTITTLLKQSMIKGDVKVMNKLMTIAQSRDDLACNPYVMAAMMGVVRHVAYGKRQLGPETCLSYLLSIYDRAYNRKALVRVGILRPDQVEAGNSGLPDAHPVALQNFIYSFVLTQTHEVRVREIWEHVVGILAGRDEKMIESLRESKFTHTTQMFHAFLLFYQRSPYTLDAMLEVLQYMLKHHPELVEIPAWAIVIHGFLRHRQENMIQFVQELMRMSARRAPTVGHAERLRAWLVRGPRYVEVVAYVRELEAGAVSQPEGEMPEK